jgi:very-short-patch-repair endonuclease
MSRTPPINRRIFTTPFAGNPRATAPQPSEGDDAIARARWLRAHATDAERILWPSLRLLRAQGHHFRRQVPLGKYFADFACKRAKLIVELDGAQHGTAEAMLDDDVRTKFLSTLGYRVLRFANDDVFDDRDGVIEAILRALTPTRPASQDDLPRWGR